VTYDVAPRGALKVANDEISLQSAAFSGGSADAATLTVFNFTYVDSKNNFGSLSFESSVTTSACGQVVQLEYAYGVIGGNWTVTETSCTSDNCQMITGETVEACLYYQRLSATQNRSATLNVEFFVYNGTSGSEDAPLPSIVGCPQNLPTSSPELFLVPAPIVNLECVSDNSLSHSCVNTPRAQCAQTTNQYAVGVGMSVGGVGVLIMSFLAILGINKLVKSA